MSLIEQHKLVWLHCKTRHHLIYFKVAALGLLEYKSVLTVTMVTTGVAKSTRTESLRIPTQTSFLFINDFLKETESHHTLLSQEVCDLVILYLVI